ncbi:MAG: LamG domain-containing protein [bacterium]|nr:LamG domain-containing protein [bacterium]
MRLRAIDITALACITLAVALLPCTGMVVNRLPRAYAASDTAVDSSLLGHMDGLDASTTFTDDGTVGNSPHAMAAAGGTDAQLDTAFKKFGTASLILDGTGDYVYAADDADWDFAGEMTIECWVRMSSNVASQAIMSHGGGADGSAVGGWLLFYNSTGDKARFEARTDVGAEITAINGPVNGLTVVDTWHHVAVTRDASNVFRVFTNGTMGATDTDATAITGGVGEQLRIGITSADGAEFAGHIDEVRISSACAYDANFDVPTGPYSK